MSGFLAPSTGSVTLDGDPEGRGCAATGCEDSRVCAPNGRCEECIDGSQCGEGLACNGFRCEGPGAQCSPCDGDWKCQSGASCQRQAPVRNSDTWPSEPSSSFAVRQRVGKSRSAVA